MSVATEITRIQEAKSDIASAIETKGVSVPSGTKIDGMAPLIEQIEYTKRDRAAENDVIFIDFDGTILYSYSAAEFAQLTELPALVATEENMEPEEWNWTLSEAKAYVATYGGLVIGQTCVTIDRNTHVWINVNEEYHEPYIGLGVNGTVIINWGEGYAESTLTGTDDTTVVFVKSPYTHGGDYHITITREGGAIYRIMGGTYDSYLCCGTTSNSAFNRIYNQCIYKVRLGYSTRVGNYAFSRCCNLESVNIRSISGGRSLFYETKVKGIVIPSGYGVSYNYMFYYSTAKFIAFSKSAVNIGTHSLSGNMRLSRVHIPADITECKTQSFYMLWSLQSIVIPAGVTNLGTYFCSGAYSLRKIKFLGSTPPTCGANCFDNISTGCVISVPIGSLSAYTSAANYPDPNTYTYIEE